MKEHYLPPPVTLQFLQAVCEPVVLSRTFHHRVGIIAVTGHGVCGERKEISGSPSERVIEITEIRASRRPVAVHGIFKVLVIEMSIVRVSGIRFKVMIADGREHWDMSQHSTHPVIIPEFVPGTDD